jgi:hypothetical protein
MSSIISLVSQKHDVSVMKGGMFVGRLAKRVLDYSSTKGNKYWFLINKCVSVMKIMKGLN